MTDIQTTEQDWGSIVRVSISREEPVYISGFNQEDAQMRGSVLKSLDNRCKGGCKILRTAIPVEVACLGTAAISAYLYAVHEEGRKEIATRLNVSMKTVDQYLSDFRHGRR